MQSTFKIYQIKYKESQKINGNCVPILNEVLDEYFENSVLVRAWDDGLIQGMTGVLSHAFFDKNNHTYQRIKEAVKEKDCYSFFGTQKNYYPNLERWHKGSVDMLREIASSVGVEIGRRDPKLIVYQNAFIASEQVWEAYIEGCLKPAIQTARGMECLWRNSGYRGKGIERVKKDIGIDYYPYHPFIFERLFSAWFDKQKFSYEQIKK